MARDYENLYDLENIGDDELKDLVLQELQEYPEIDVDLIVVDVQDGAVRVSGRVGTEQEIQQVGHVLTDLIGIDEVSNELVIDELVRGQHSEAADDARAEDGEVDAQTGEQTVRASDTAAHLVEDLEAEHFGTHNYDETMQRGTTYEPPDRGIQEGILGRENH
ncbi:MAG: BON domain-containing protein [Gemmatimonadota bacterium]